MYSEGTANLLDAMAIHGVKTLCVVSAVPAGPHEQNSFLNRNIALPILERFFGATYRDMRRMEQLLRTSEANWIAVRPPRLLERPARGTYRLDRTPVPNGRSITIADLASCLLDCIDRPDLARTVAYVAN